MEGLLEYLKSGDERLVFTLVGFGAIGAVVAVKTILGPLGPLIIEWWNSKPGLHKKMQELQAKNQKSVDTRKPPDVWNTVLMFPDRFPAELNSSTSKLLKFIDEARMSIHISMYLASYPPFEILLGRKHREGLIIQIVTDFDSLTAHFNATIKNLMNHGIPVRATKSEHLMHHKFVIIDEEALLTGSLNYTKQGITGNWENVLVTTDHRHVRPYIEEFRKLWQSFQDANLLMDARDKRN